MKFFKSFDEFNNWNYDNCQAKLVDVFTRSGNNFVVLDRISGSYYCNPKYFETDIDAKIYAKDNFILKRVVIMLFDMEQYIASYKHLIGCEFYLKDRRQKGKFIINVFTDNDGCISHVHCNVGYEYRFIHHTDLMLYLADGAHVNDSATLGTYKQYMQLHYPEYKHVWSKQL